MLGVERGQVIWNTVEGTEGKSCASCHGDAAESMKGVGANYPKWDAGRQPPDQHRAADQQVPRENMGAEPYEFDKGGQKELTAYIKHQSLGTPVRSISARANCRAWWEKGKEIYYTRTAS
jgi:L-cysteine S-thiosulfotransferase